VYVGYRFADAQAFQDSASEETAEDAPEAGGPAGEPEEAS
jgi:hypothetical protein